MSENGRGKPLLFGQDLHDETLAAIDSGALARVADNPNWIPGYSEQIVLQELAAAEYGSMSYQQRAHQARELGVSEIKDPPVRFKSVRVAGLDGRQNDNVLLDLTRYQSEGWRFASLEDLSRYGYSLPPMYHVAADGKIQRGDVALMVVDAKRAKQIKERKLQETAAREASEGVHGDSTGVPIMVEQTRDPNFSF